MEEPWNPETVHCPMCPATGQWREKVVGFGSNYVYKLGFDGLYIDQVASFNATLCYEKNHGHPVGGGTWWADSYQQMVRQLRNKINKGCILTSESCCKVYCGVLTFFWFFTARIL